jgi:hypothetical protein
MYRPLRFARSLAPKLVVGGLCAAATASSFAGGGAPIPPCSPDGMCLPRVETWGWYETRWRPFPGDTIAGMPTEARPGAADGDAQDELGGPRIPSASEETRVGPERPPRSGGRAPEPTLPPAGGVGPAVPEGPGPVPAPEGGAVPVPMGEGGLPALDALPQPGQATPPASTTDPIDPFGAAPPTPPAWMVERTSFEPLPAGHTSAPAQPVNLKSDDAPPELPAGLQSMLRPANGRPAWSPTADETVVLVQPGQVLPVAGTPKGRGVIQTSAETPLGIQLINPASAIAPMADESGLQQAIYFEDSDQSTEGSLTLPPVAPTN